MEGATRGRGQVGEHDGRRANLEGALIQIERRLQVSEVEPNVGRIVHDHDVARDILDPLLIHRIRRSEVALAPRQARGRFPSQQIVGSGGLESGAVAGQGDTTTGRQGGWGGMAKRAAMDIDDRTGRENRHLVLGHLQRGGGPNSYDRLLALRFGAAAVKLVRDVRFGCIVALDPPDVLAVPLGQAIATIKTVPLDGDIIQTARALGTCLGD